MELHQQQTQNWWIRHYTEKVKSYINIEQVPDPFLWECNEVADKLATKAREGTTRLYAIHKLPTPFQAIKIGYFIQGWLQNND